MVISQVGGFLARDGKLATHFMVEINLSLSKVCVFVSYFHSFGLFIKVDCVCDFLTV